MSKKVAKKPAKKAVSTKKQTKKPVKKTAAAKKPTTRKPRKTAVAAAPVQDVAVKPVVDPSGVVMITPVVPDVVNS